MKFDQFRCLLQIADICRREIASDWWMQFIVDLASLFIRLREVENLHMIR